MGLECCIGRGGPGGLSWTVDVCKLEEPEKEVTVLVGVGSPEAGTQQRGQIHV